MSKQDCSFRFQGHYVNRQIFPNGRYKVMLWTQDSLDQESIADVSFCGGSHKECMDKLREWLKLNEEWVRLRSYDY